MIIGCDFHPRFQQIALIDQETGEHGKRRLSHREEAEQFYCSLADRQVRVGMEATGSYRWFQRLLVSQGYELCLGDAPQIRASSPRRQKTDRRDAEQILRLLVEDRFPAVWLPDCANQDLRALVLHRNQQVQLRTRMKNQLDALAKSEGLTSPDRPKECCAPSPLPSAPPDAATASPAAHRVTAQLPIPVRPTPGQPWFCYSSRNR